MRKDLGNKMQFMPLPVLMLATYDQDGKANVMNAAWVVFMIIIKFMYHFLNIKQQIIWN